MTSISPCTIVLDTPEILSLIAECIPLWCPLEHGQFKFRPATLLRLCSVSKTWQRAMLPVLWRVHCAANLTHVPRSALEPNSIHTRFYLDNFSVPENARHHLDFSLVRRMWIEDNGTTAQKWIRQTTTLTHLHWNNLFYRAIPDLQDLLGSIQSKLTKLELCRWEIPPLILLDILTRLPHLTSLSLNRGSLNVGTLSESALPQSCLFPLKEFTTDITETKTLLFRQIMACSPDLERLMLKGDFSQTGELPDIAQGAFLIQGLDRAREFCPKVRTVQIEYTCPPHVFKGRSRCLITVAVSGRDGKSGSLLQLEAVVRTFKGQISKMIFRDANTLQSLKITSFRDEVEVNAKNLLKVVRSPKFLHLHTLHFLGEYQFTKGGTLSLFEKKWSCSQLGNLLLDGLYSLKTEDKTPMMVLPNGEVSRWEPVWEKSRFGAKLQELIHLRLNELSKLRFVSLNGVRFEKVHR
ncbi:hypothetical protein EMPS_06952 [Entomortierella parvispora]|uniref:Uncharacterized protein n=1 Tax=Entomortierella parvispora TaxID=205924 RepID=A0A9P3HDD4_9FUNG|nr:hypothetical protein EMPS_06952 [Entomortierella parvispora]